MARLDFANYNFDDLVKQLRAIIKTKDAWKDISVESGTGNVLIELFSYTTEMVMYYLERRAQESYIDTAQLRTSLVRLVSLINYKPRRQTSSRGELTFNIPSTIWWPYDIFLPKGTVVQTSGGAQFIVWKGGVLENGKIISDPIDAIQGVLVTMPPITSDGSPDMEIAINDVNVEDSDPLSPTILVTVDGEEWVQADNFVYADSESKIFVQETQLDGTVVLKFGDGVFGKIPPNSVTIVVQYVQTLGAAGNVYSTGQITTIVSPIYDSQGTVITDIGVTNSSLFLGGADVETADEIKRLAPAVFKTGQRAVTREDYIAIIEDLRGVATAYVWGERDVLHDYWETSYAYYVNDYVTDVVDNTVWQCAVNNTSGTGSFAADRAANPTWWTPIFRYANITMFNQVKVVCLYDDWIVPDNARKIDIQNALIHKEQLTVWLNFVDPIVVDTILDIDLKVLEAYQNSQIVSNVQAAINAEFALGTGVRLGTPVRGADVTQTIENVVGVDYSHLAIRHKETLGVGDSGQTVFSKGGLPLYLAPILPNSVQIYKDAVLVAVDNGLGSISGTGVTGSIDYTTGLISVTFGSAPGTGEVIRAYYRQDKEGDIIVGKGEIVKLVQTNITLL